LIFCKGKKRYLLSAKECHYDWQEDQEVLQNHLHLWIDNLGSTHFLQDGAPCHASKRVRDFLKDQLFKVMD
jgi:hypothetical protein